MYKEIMDKATMDRKIMEEKATDNEITAQGIYLTDLIDVETLQRVQDAFSNLTGMAALTTDLSGKPVTVGSHFTDFCMKYIRSSDEGARYCEWCDKYGAEQTAERGHQATYYCHAGLIDFAAPINVKGQQVGCFIGGQVLTTKPNPAKIRSVAELLGVDPDLLVEAANKVNILKKDVIDKGAQFLYELASVLSDMAYSKYVTQLAEQKMEKANQLKSDFLANMSHEIRTPMNAVIGMAEMALREDLPPAARYHINQIKSSGRELLTIINDILDFSKIESGMLNIIPVEYEAMSIVNDVVNIIMTRLQNKDVELIFKLRPDMPRRLYGDNIRIKQILINIANNAAKFTKEGMITIEMNYRNLSEDEIEMQVSVEDTGIGIKEEDLTKIFQSFQQVDSKRNRNIEGTGLGLAISKQLLSLMGGDIQVESVYGRGSKFSFSFPQKVLNAEASIELEQPENKAVAGLIENSYVKEQLAADCETFGVCYADISTKTELEEYAALHEGKELFFLVEKKLFDGKLENFAKENTQIKVVLLVDYFEDNKYDIPNLKVVKKPIYALNLANLLNGSDTDFIFFDQGDDGCDFVAPRAEILIVDDNSVNLTIAEGLLKPLQMKIQTAASGVEAIEKVQKSRFDIIFMDHMMPEMDGVEATHLIRQMEDYRDTPIIALSANAIGGIREKFLEEGMSDFVAKPIELRTLLAKVKQWLPPEKIQAAETKKGSEAEKEEEILPDQVGDLDVSMALGLLGSKELFYTILEKYYKSIEKKANVINESYTKEDWGNYTIEVHALKSLSRQIGANSLADMAAELEKAGHDRNVEYIKRHTDSLLKKYRGYIPVLQPYFPEEEKTETGEDISNEILREFFREMREATEDLDIDRMEALMADMEHYCYKDEQKFFDQMKEAVESMDTEECEKILKEWEDSL